jgi:hypothetical protein
MKKRDPRKLTPADVKRMKRDAMLQRVGKKLKAELESPEFVKVLKAGLPTKKRRKTWEFRKAYKVGALVFPTSREASRWGEPVVVEYASRVTLSALIGKELTRTQYKDWCAAHDTQELSHG